MQQAGDAGRLCAPGDHVREQPPENIGWHEQNGGCVDRFVVLIEVAQGLSPSGKTCSLQRFDKGRRARL
mgnify:CR=1 FL=1